MRVFVAWAEDRSRRFAEIFRNWLVQVVQAADPFISTEIEKGARWSEEIKVALNTSKIGVLVVTPENAANTWMHFEAGALSGHLDKQRVCVLLFGMSPADLSGPLTQFQSSQFIKADVLRLVRAINSALEKPLAERALELTFEKWWPDFESEVAKVPASSVLPQRRSEREVLEEILERVRRLSETGTATPGWSDSNLASSPATKALAELLVHRESLRLHPTGGELRRSAWQEALDLLTEEDGKTDPRR